MGQGDPVTAVVVGVCLAILAVGCGGGGDEQGGIVSPTADVTAPEETSERTPRATPTAMSPKEEYRAMMLGLLPEIDQIFSVEWPQALGTEPRFGEEWQDAVSRLVARIEGFATRVDAMEPPEDFAVSHALYVDSINGMAEAVRKVLVAGPRQDLEGLQEALADTQIADQLMAEAFKVFATPSPTATRTAYPTVVPPREDRASLEAVLRLAIPGLEQLPSGFVLEREVFETNEEEVADATQLDPSLDELEAWGRLLGFATEYDRSGFDQRLRLEVEIFKTVGGATDAFRSETARVDTEESEAEAREALGASTAEFDRMSFVNLGDESNAFRGVMTIPRSGSGEIQLILHSIGLRREYLVGYIQVWSIASSTPSIEELETIGRALDDGMKVALE